MDILQKAWIASDLPCIKRVGQRVENSGIIEYFVEFFGERGWSWESDFYLMYECMGYEHVVAFDDLIFKCGRK